MRILALDTSGPFLSVALLDGGIILAEITMEAPFEHSVNIMPVIKEAFQLARITLKDIDLFACTVGPGSFTGLRIGLATIKGLAIVQDKPIVAVSTLEAMTASFPLTDIVVRPLLPASQERVYTAVYKISAPFSFELLQEEKISELGTLLTMIKEQELLIIATSLMKGRVHFLQKLMSMIPSLRYCSYPIKVSSIGFLAAKKFKEGNATKAVSIKPKYMSLSHAEERANCEKR